MPTKRENSSVIIDIGKDFGRFPGGRLKSTATLSGEQFRDEHLTPYLKESRAVEVIMDNAVSYGSSFLDEAFAGLVRYGVIKPSSLDNFYEKIKVITNRPALKKQIDFFVESEIKRQSENKK